MKLHQLLRFIVPTAAICIFDIQGVEICTVRSKEFINTDLFDYDVFEISCIGLNMNTPAFMIVIKK